MTPEEIKELLKESLTEIKTEILSEVDRKNAGLASNLTKEIKKLSTSASSTTSAEGEPDEPQQKLSLKALQTQLSELQNQLTEKDKQTFVAKRASAVAQSVSKSNVLNASAFQKLFMLEHGELIKEEGNEWFIDKGGQVTRLDEAIKSYLSTDDGKIFVPPSGVNGSSSQETKPKGSQPQTKLTAAQALMEAF